ncbi:Dual oxidase [Lamellibrachia satsuma]|nr:Dual oxidase [Lamellibrachia satsuma]
MLTIEDWCHILPSPQSSNVGELKTAEDMENHECKDIVSCELSREEFAESLAMKPDSVFINQMFSLIDRDRNGYISFGELLYAVVLFSKGGPEDKMELLFHMYDMDKSGTLDKEEVTALVKSILEMAHSDLTSAETDQLVEKMFVTAELDKHGVLTLENFVKMLAGEQRMMWDVSLEWKGMNRCKYMKSSSHKKSLNEVSQKTGPDNWDNGHRINFSGMTHPVTAGSSKFIQLVEPVRSYIETYHQHIVCLLLFFGVNLLVFSHKFYYYAIEQEHRGFRSIGGYWVSLSRGGAAGMSFSFSFILLTMCRNLITKLRETVLNQYLPFDAHVTFHVIVAYTAFFFMFLHVFGYCLIFYEVSTQPAEFLCIFREVSLSPTFLPKFHYWLFGTLPGTYFITLSE